MENIEKELQEMENFDLPKLERGVSVIPCEQCGKEIRFRGYAEHI